jgi:hypothetical protein
MLVQQFDIHEATLRKRLKLNLTGGLKIRILLRNKKANCATTFKMFYGVTMIEVRCIAYEFTDRKKCTA